MDWDVAKANVMEHLTLSVCFADGTSGLVVFEPSHLTGVFEPLNSPDFFQKVYIDHGVVTWPGEIDLAPDAMYQAIKNHGVWVLK